MTVNPRCSIQRSISLAPACFDKVASATATEKNFGLFDTAVKTNNWTSFWDYLAEQKQFEKDTGTWANIQDRVKNGTVLTEKQQQDTFLTLFKAYLNSLTVQPNTILSPYQGSNSPFTRFPMPPPTPAGAGGLGINPARLTPVLGT